MQASGVAVVLSGPGAGTTCSGPRSIRIRIAHRRRVGLRSATIYVDGRRSRFLRGRALPHLITLRIPAGRAVRIRILLRTRAGRRITVRRTFPACRSVSPSSAVPERRDPDHDADRDGPRES